MKQFLGLNEDWWTHIILPVGIPLFGFLLLKVFYYVRDKQKKLKALKAKQDFLFTWINLIKNQIDKQTEEYKNFAKHLRDLEISQTGLGKYNLSLEKLEYYNSEDLITLFVKGRKGKETELNELLFKYENSVDFLKRKQEFIKSTFEELKTIYGLTSNEWNKGFYKFRDILHKIGLQQNVSSSEAAENILKINVHFSNTTEGTMKTIMANLISVIGPIANNEINKNPKDALMRELIEILVQLKNVYRSRESHFNKIASLFEETAEKMNESFGKLVAVKNVLEKTPFKNLITI